MIHEEMKKAAGHIRRFAKWTESAEEVTSEAAGKYRAAAEANEPGRESHRAGLQEAAPVCEKAAESIREARRALIIAAAALDKAAAAGRAGTLEALRGTLKAAGLNPDRLTDSQILSAGKHAARKG